MGFTIKPLFKYKQSPGPYPKQSRGTHPSCNPGSWPFPGFSACSLRDMGAGLPPALPLPLSTPDFNSVSGRKQQWLQGNGACATEVTSQVSRLEQLCLNWSLCKHSILLTHQEHLPFNSHQLVESLTAAAFFER